MGLNVYDFVSTRLHDIMSGEKISLDSLSSKTNIPLPILMNIGSGVGVKNEFYYLMKISEILGCEYYNFFENDDVDFSYTSNVEIPEEVIQIIFEEMDKKGISFFQFCEDIGVEENAVLAWRAGMAVLPAFYFQNALGRLALNSDDFVFLLKEEKEEQKAKISKPTSIRFDSPMFAEIFRQYMDALMLIQGSVDKYIDSLDKTITALEGLDESIKALKVMRDELKKIR